MSQTLREVHQRGEREDSSAEQEPTPCRHDDTWGAGITVSVLILNWNGADLLMPCLTAVLKDACKHVEVVVVDNGSTDDSIDLVTNNFARARVIALPRNFTFAAAYNKAAAQCSGTYLVFLNNDTEVARGWLQPLVDEFLRDPTIGIASSELLFIGTRTINSAGGLLTLWQGTFEIGFGRPESYLKSKRILEPFYASGAAMAIPRDLFLRLGGFDVNVSMYGEDLDLSWRARLLGYRIACVTDSVVFHHLSHSAGIFDPDKVRLVTNHHLVVMFKCLSAKHLVHSIPAYAAFAVAKGAALSVAERNPRYLTKTAIAIRDALRSIPAVWQQRREVQATRTESDRTVFKSEGFGLIKSPASLINVFRQGQRVRKTRPDTSR